MTVALTTLTTIIFIVLVIAYISVETVRYFKVSKATKSLRDSVKKEQQWISNEINPFLRKEVFVVNVFTDSGDIFVVLENKVGKCLSMNLEDFVDTFEPVHPNSEQYEAIEILNKWEE